MENTSETSAAPVEGKTQKFNPLWGLGIVVVLAILFLPMVLRGGKQESSSSEAREAEVVASPAAEAMMENSAGSVGEVKTVSVEAGSFYFKPNEIRVKKGEKVIIELKSADMMHDFNIDELGVKLPITKAGETGSAEFTVEQAGTFEYYCSVGQHRKNGQVGKLIVE